MYFCKTKNKSKMAIKIIFSDIDGTLLNNERQVSQNTIKQIQKIKEKIPFVLVSARMPKQMKHIQDDLCIVGSPMIAYNGALVICDNQIIHSQEVPVSLVKKIIEYNKEVAQNQVHISLYNADEWYAPEYDFWAKREENNTKSSPEILSNEAALDLWEKQGKGVHKLMLMGEKNLIQAIYEFLCQNFDNQLHIYRSKDTYIEVSHISVSKLTGIKMLLNHKYHCSLEEVMAFGDNYNDVEMLQNVGHGVAVENAVEPAKNVANVITNHHKEEGVANYLKNYFK